jgi:hypothetical protein
MWKGERPRHDQKRPSFRRWHMFVAQLRNKPAPPTHLSSSCFTWRPGGGSRAGGRSGDAGSDRRVLRTKSGPTNQNTRRAISQLYMRRVDGLLFLFSLGGGASGGQDAFGRSGNGAVWEGIKSCSVAESRCDRRCTFLGVFAVWPRLRRPG